MSIVQTWREARLAASALHDMNAAMFPDPQRAPPPMPTVKPRRPDADTRRQFYAIQAEQAIGAFMVEKFRKQAQESGLETAARNCRKQGIPARIVAMMWAALRPG